MKIFIKVITSLFLSVLFLVSFGASCAKCEYYQTIRRSEYRAQFEAIYSKFEEDDGPYQKLYGLEALIHFSPVNVNGHPFYEAAFLERVGHAALAIGSSEAKFGSGIESDGPFYGLDVIYMRPDNPFVIKADLARADFEFNPPIDGKWIANGIGAGLGFFLRESLIFGFEYFHAETEISISGRPKEESKSDDYTVLGKWVHKFGDWRAINIEGSIEVDQFDDNNDDGTNTIISVESDYYLNSSISIGGEMALNTGDDKYNEGKTFAIRLITFFNPGFYVRVDFEKFFADNDDGNDEQNIHANIGVRF